MANNSGGPRYTRPLLNERAGPRFNSPSSITNSKPPTNKTLQQPQTTTPIKSMNETIIMPQQNSDSSASANKTEVTETKNGLSNNMSISENLQNSTDTKPPDDKQKASGQKRPRSDIDVQSSNASFNSITSSSQQQTSEKKTNQSGRCRLFIGNIPADLTKDEFQLLFGKYGELVEYFANPSRGFGFVKLSSRQLAEQAKYDLDGYVLRGKALRIRFASQGATVKVKNLSPNVSNELLKDAFEQYFGGVERAIVIVDDRGKSTGEGIIEFEKKPSAQKCLNECTERCFFITSELRPVTVEPWDMKDDEDGLPEKSLARNAAFIKEREAMPHFAESNTIEHTIGLKWKELELQEKQLLEEVKKRMQFATEQVKVEIEQMYLEHQSQVLREELFRRQEDLRRIDELRSQEIDRRRNMMPMHHADIYPNQFNMSTAPVSNIFHQKQANPSSLQYNNFQHTPYPNVNPLMQQAAHIDAAYTTNQVARGYGLANAHFNEDNLIQHHQHQGFDRKRPRY